MVKNLPAKAGNARGNLEKEWQPTPVSLPGKFYGQKSLVGYRPWGRKRVGHN